MEKILLIADSPCDIFPEDRVDLPVWVPSVRVTYGGAEHFERDIVLEEYWKHLEDSPVIPVTSMVNAYDWRENFKNAAKEGYTHVIACPISSTAAGNYQAALMAVEDYNAEMGDDAIPVFVQDSRGYSWTYGRCVLETAVFVKNGAGFREAVHYLRDRISRMQAMLWVYSLKHLKKSGRISGMAAFAGEALGIRPLLHIRDGSIAPIDKVRGEKNLLPRAIALIKERVINPEIQDMVVMYADIPESVETICAAVEEAFHPRSIRAHRLGCAVTTNCGAQSVAILFDGEPFDLDPSPMQHLVDADG